MSQSATLSIVLLLAAIAGLATTTPAPAATAATLRINGDPRLATTRYQGGDNRHPPRHLSQENDMNKKQLAALLAAIVRATATAADTVMATTEDEARTLVGMRLRRIASSVVEEASGVDAETAAEHLKDAVETLATEAADKKAAKADAGDDGDDS